MADEKYSAEARAARLWKISMATTLDADHLALADELVEEVARDPEQAAYLIAVLVQLAE